MDRYENINILVVDDLPDKLLVYRTILEELGVNIVTARSGPEALRLVLQHEFAVILLDVNMPDMDGFETAALIHGRKRSAHTPIIFVTAYMDEFHTAQGYAQGAVDYILTPVVPEILRTKVKVFVDLFRMTQQVRKQAEERIALAEEHARRVAAEEASRRSAFLSEVSAALMGSMELDSRVGDLVRLPLPLLADVGIARLVDHAGDEVQTHWAWFDPRRAAAVDQPVDRDRLNPLLLAALKRALESGQTEILPPQETPLEAGDESPYADAEPEPSGPPRTLCHMGVFPMVARGKTIGAILLARAGERSPFDRDDCRLAEELALRGAIAIDNIGLYRSIREADRRKDEFLAMLAHELRNPLAPISNAVEIMRLRGPEHSELDWARDVIARQVQHLVRLVDDLLDVSRITRGKIRLKLEPIDLAAVVSNAVETSRPLIEGRRHRFVADMPTEAIWVKADPARLAQVLANLLNNAAKYTEEGGSIRISVARDGGQAVVRVRDSGVGIPPEMLAGIFDLFTQVDRTLDRSQGGLGIGLTLVQRLVQMHGGSVEAQSDGPGQGSEFVVRLPMLTAFQPPRLATPPPAERESAAGHLRILVVDDNADAAVSLSMLLRLDGHEVHMVHSGPAALDAVRELRPDVVMLDIGLPEMDGYEVARRLRAEPGGADLSLVAVTGYGQDEDQRRCRAAGFDHHLVKPVDPQALSTLLTSMPATAGNFAASE